MRACMSTFSSLERGTLGGVTTFRFTRGLLATWVGTGALEGIRFSDFVIDCINFVKLRGGG